MAPPRARCCRLGYPLKPRLAFQLPLLVLIRTVINTFIRMVYPFLPILGRGLGVDLQQMSFALTLRYISGIAGPFLAPVADSKGRKAGMLLGLCLFTLGVGIMAVWPSFPTFVAALALSLIGNFVFMPSLQAYLGDRVPYRRRGFTLALSELGWSISFIIGVPLVGWLIAQYGWHSPFPLLAGLGAASILTLVAIIPPDQAGRVKKPGFWMNLKAVFKHPPALAGILAGLLISVSNELVNLVFGVWIEDSFGVKIAALALASAIIGISELSGELLVGGLSDRLGKRRSVASGIVFNCLAVLALSAIGKNLAGALVGLFLFYITFEFSIVSMIPLMTEVLPEARASVMALFIAGISLGRAAGALLAPILYEAGWLPAGFSRLFFLSVGAAALNLLALAALRLVKEKEKSEG